MKRKTKRKRTALDIELAKRKRHRKFVQNEIKFTNAFWRLFETQRRLRQRFAKTHGGEYDFKRMCFTGVGSPT